MGPSLRCRHPLEAEGLGLWPQSLASPVSFSLVPVYAQSLKLPPVLCLSLSFLSGRPRNNDLGACSFQGYTMGE